MIEILQNMQGDRKCQASLLFYFYYFSGLGLILKSQRSLKENCSNKENSCTSLSCLYSLAGNILLHAHIFMLILSALLGV